MKKASLGGKALSFLFSAVGSLPLWVLYGIADIVALLAATVGYRQKVIRGNLLLCFPDMPKKELKKAEWEFYRFLGDYFLETLHLGRMSPCEMEKRLKFENIDEINQLLSDGKSITAYLGHYCNWEWISSLPLHLTAENSVAGQIYHPLENEASDYAFLKIRGHFGAQSIDMEKVLPVLRELRREGKPSIVGYISDQAPLLDSVHYIADFFGQPTLTYTGPERLAKTFATPVYYIDVRRPKRGYYVARFVKMSDDASKEPPFSLTQRYYELLEASIRRAPQFWLWSHRRWKRMPEDFIRQYGEESARKRLSRP